MSDQDDLFPGNSSSDSEEKNKTKETKVAKSQINKQTDKI